MIDITNYDKNNVFAKILKGEIPSKKIFENEYVFALEDINPQAPIHILIIQKNHSVVLLTFLRKPINTSYHAFLNHLMIYRIH